MLNTMTETTRIYADAAAARPLSLEAKKAMIEALALFGNPGSLHKEGVAAKKLLESSRKAIADTVGAASGYKTIFTSGGTESCNMAITGVLETYKKLNPHKKAHVVCSAIEHSAVLASLQAAGVAVTYVSPSAEGVVSANDMLKAITDDTVLVILMATNNETGVHQEVTVLGKGLQRLDSTVLFMCDASQALGSIALDVRQLHTDFLVLSAGKVGGPKGVGALIMKDDIAFTPIIHGGGQEFGMRSGTERVAGAAAFAAAMKFQHVDTDVDTYFIDKLKQLAPDAYVVGGMPGPHKKSGMHYVQFNDIDAEAFVLYMDARGIAVGTGAACDSQKKSGSHVLKAMGLREEGAIRFSFLPSVTKEEVDAVLQAIKEVLRSK
ncbi:MAG: aminotransferase class V-fold PLP-dependent enzyme [Candidatus Magasanikbacteria bacterium]|jgi:cysteine desulfurase|nr:aminotransferase class V-fold PLP-dependent enzyme [Candidatus Magasanikbacteria bacterium]